MTSLVLLVLYGTTILSLTQHRRPQPMEILNALLAFLVVANCLLRGHLFQLMALQTVVFFDTLWAEIVSKALELYLDLRTQDYQTLQAQDERARRRERPTA